MIVAAKNAMLDTWSNFFRDAGYHLSAIDVDIFRIVNAYLTTVPDEQAEQTVALFNIGEKESDDRIHHERSVPFRPDPHQRFDESRGHAFKPPSRN